MIRNLSTYLFILLLIVFSISTKAQEIERPQPKLWLGVSGAVNYNIYTGTTQTLNSEIKAPSAFHEGSGIMPYGSVLIEYRPIPLLGFMLNLGYDNRGGAFSETASPCNCPEDLKTPLSYVTVEPSLRFTPFKTGLYLFVGGVYSYNINHNFSYTIDYDNDDLSDTYEGKFSDINQHLFSTQVGLGYDIPLSSKSSANQVSLSPFVSFHPYFGHHPRSVESWSLSTARAGIAFKFGKTKAIVPPVVPIVPVVVAPVIIEPDVQFTVNSPKNIPVQRNMSETFPIRNHIYFDLGSTKIPDRYVLLEKNQVAEFKEDQLEVFIPKNYSGRSKREMTAYYNVLNILGDRMSKNPSATINLVGSSEDGPADGTLMAQSVKDYLTGIFGISATRIAVEGRDKPKIPGEQPGGTLELVKLREGDRRVSIESSSPVLLMEFQSGSDAPLKPVEIIAVQEAPLDSYVSFNAAGSDEAFKSWKLEVTDEKGKVQNFGPYTQEQVSIPGKSILGDRPEGDYKMTMVGTTKNGNTVRKELYEHMALWTPDAADQGNRFSILYEFNNSESIRIYEKYLTEVITPKIPKNGTVIIHGYTDDIGDAGNNLTLSRARANDVKGILESALAAKGRNDVKFDIRAFGEDESMSYFNNDSPEGRSYNRSVIIDLIPPKK